MIDKGRYSILYLMASQGSTYGPPYDSPIEDLFAYNIVKYLDPSAILHKQVEIKTVCGLFRIDFVIQTDSLKVAVECDGADYHDWNRDEWRDAMIMGTNTVDFMYRLRGTDIYRHAGDILYVISRNHPSLFSRRGLLNIASLANEGAKEYHPTASLSFVTIRYQNENGKVYDSVEMDVRQRDIPSGTRQMWQSYFRRAMLKPGRTLDELIKEYNDEIQKNVDRMENDQ